jgi:hypothetical protein
MHLLAAKASNPTFINNIASGISHTKDKVISDTAFQDTIFCGALCIVYVCT